jgi:hypothetical protein
MDGLGVHVLLGETLLELLRRVEAGEDAESVYMEMYASADHVSLEDDGDV